MKALTYLFPTIALAGAALLLTTSEGTYGFTTLGGTLDVETQRDWRVFDNFTEPGANNNETPDPMYPGWQGAEMAIWKAASEWASRPHGDGSGDPTQPVLGSGGANFDFVFAGRAASAGDVNDNVVSVAPFCGGGVYAFALTPIQDGWQIQFCPEWNWVDGPNPANGTNQDIQGVVTAIFGHALGLGHSSDPQATMNAAPDFPSNAIRSLEADDIAGVQFLYGVASPGKVQISDVAHDSGTNVLSITGQNFPATDNQVWFTNGNVTPPGADPRVIVSGVSSTAGGTQIAVTVPANAATGGDVHVKGDFSGGSSLSNGYPYTTDPVPPGEAPSITAVTPNPVESLLVGTAQTVSIFGSDFTPDMTVTLDGILVDEARMTRLGTGLVTVDMPTVTQLGTITVEVENPGGSDASTLTVVAPAGLVLQVGDGDNGSISSADGVDIATAGPVGTVHWVILSSSNVPSVIAIVSLDLGNNFSDLNLATVHTIPANGVFEENIPIPPTFAFWYFQSISLNFGTPIPTSNLQSYVIFR